MKASQSATAQVGTSDVGAVENVWTIPLPHSVRGNDARVRSIAANLLALPDVRSVVVDCERAVATANFRPNRRLPSGVVEIPTSIFVEPATDDNQAERDGDGAQESIVSWTNPSDGATCFIALPPSARGFRRALLLAAAAGTLALGLAGIMLPGLPTTPFVLVASYCLLRSSPALHGRLLHSRLLGGVLRA